MDWMVIILAHLLDRGIEAMKIVGARQTTAVEAQMGAIETMIIGDRIPRDQSRHPRNQGRIGTGRMPLHLHLHLHPLVRTALGHRHLPHYPYPFQATDKGIPSHLNRRLVPIPFPLPLRPQECSRGRSQCRPSSPNPLLLSRQPGALFPLPHPHPHPTSTDRTHRPRPCLHIRPLCL